jgi:hypothetical protein
MRELTRDLSLALAVVIGAAGHAAAQGIIEGLVNSTSGQNLGGAIVLVSSDPGSISGNGPRVYHGVTDEAGRFSIGGIADGRYRVCAVAGGFADPCRWSEGTLVSVGRDRKQLRIAVPEGRRLRVAVEDAGNHLPSEERPGEPALLVVELSDSLGRRWHLLPMTASSPEARIYEDVVPAGAKLSLRASGRGLLLEDSHGNRNNAAAELLVSASAPVDKAASIRTVPPMFGRMTPSPDVTIVLKVVGRK